MIFTEPVTFSEAVQLLAEKQILPTDLSFAELRDFDATIRAQSIYSARTIKAQYLQRVKDVLADLLGGKINRATARLLLKQELAAMRYTPEAGFGEGEAPPAEPGGIRDLGSTRRIDLVLQTNTRLIANKAFQKAGQTDFALYAWPCYELVRIFPRHVPRGKKLLKAGLVDNPGTDWPARWVAAGGQFYGNGRMIARKDDNIWNVLGDPSVFADALETDVPPFAFNSGFGWREIRRDEAIALGVMERGAEIQPPEKGPKPEVQSPKSISGQQAQAREEADRFDPEFLRSIKAGIASERARLTSIIDARRPEGVPLDQLAPEFRYTGRNP